MNFDLSEDQELFRAAVERFVQPVDTEFRRRLRSKPEGYDLARWRELAELGLLALSVGEDSGGMSGGPIDLALVAEALGKGKIVKKVVYVDMHGVLVEFRSANDEAEAQGLGCWETDGYPWAAGNALAAELGLDACAES